MTEKFTDEEVGEFRGAFEQHDQDHDGTISRAELDEVLRSLSQRLPDSDLKTLFEKADDDGDGRINFNECMYLLEQLFRSEGHEQDLLLAFQALDSDGDGLVSAAEFRRVLIKATDGLSDEEALEMIHAVHADVHGKLNYEQFSRILLAR